MDYKGYKTLILLWVIYVLRVIYIYMVNVFLYGIKHGLQMDGWKKASPQMPISPTKTWDWHGSARTFLGFQKTGDLILNTNGTSQFNPLIKWETPGDLKEESWSLIH